MSSTFKVVRIENEGVLSGCLFLDPAFIAYQARVQGKRLVTFAARSSGDETVAELTFAAAPGGPWTSPVTGAFGGVATIERAPAEAIFQLTESATAWLRDQGAAPSASVRLPPDTLSDAGAAFENALFRAGWRLDQADISYHHEVVPAEAFIATLGETKQKELRRLKRSGAAFRKLTADEGRLAYAVIAENREARGFPMTMSWPQVEALTQTFPDRVEFSAVARGDDVLAGAIVLRLTPAYCYVFYWGEAVVARRESPVTLIAEGLIADGHARGVKVLDIGTSTDRSEPNLGLMAFKEGLRCLRSGKRTYVLDLA